MNLHVRLVAFCLVYNFAEYAAEVKGIKPFAPKEIKETIFSILEENGTSTISIQELRGVQNVQGSAKAPCTCQEASCSCCTGAILYFFAINVRNRVCSVFTYDPDETALGVKLKLNDNTFFQRKISAKSPPPICVPFPRLAALRFCLRFNNVYLIQRNVHACVTFETQWNKETAFQYQFDCFRMGQNGFAVVKPEDGGGLPTGTNSETDDIEDYDENVTDPPVKPNKNKIRSSTATPLAIQTVINNLV